MLPKLQYRLKCAKIRPFFYFFLFHYTPFGIELWNILEATEYIHKFLYYYCFFFLSYLVCCLANSKNCRYFDSLGGKKIETKLNYYNKHQFDAAITLNRFALGRRKLCAIYFYYNDYFFINWRTFPLYYSFAYWYCVPFLDSTLTVQLDFSNIYKPSLQLSSHTVFSSADT